MVPPWYHHFFKISYIAGNGDAFTLNIPYRRLKKSVFNLGEMKTKYIRFYSVLPNMLNKDFNKHMLRVRKLARNI